MQVSLKWNLRPVRLGLGEMISPRKSSELFAKLSEDKHIYAESK